ncbi:hypothetical protein EV663_10738 [Rhodovulum bhavnagarense]|uniref:Uncharacterized protein n=1 Tax=Rhodovulum bhavnagarense TaxID=992286 RepID=A0A4R2RE99_9RHOB|nr:hypothetical protein [Rhodovulum bhavnagarense]TCP60864.1 hypothetical protein EV663_10738 [Rhodovulum bhavnagarense]
MYDPQMREFHGRLARLDRMHRRGFGFEAPGTIGRSCYTRRNRARLPILRPLIVVAASVLVIKALILSQVGALDYNDRLARAADGSLVERAGAYVMQVDPLTAWLGDALREMVPARGRG